VAAVAACRDTISLAMDPKAQGYAVFEELRADMMRMAGAILRGARTRMTAEDLVQAVLGKIWAGLSAGTLDVDSIGSPRHFAYASLKNQYLDIVRGAAHAREHLRHDDTIREQASTEPHPGDRVALSRALIALGEDERRFLVRVVVEGDSVEGAQRALGWPPRSPHYHLRTILARLRAELEPTGGEP
jgi:DNA-directed RNA polymerase specialized sigma24 family protein